MKFIALSLSSFLLAHVASAQGPGSLARHDGVSPLSSYAVASVGAPMSATENSFLQRTEPRETGWAIAQGTLDSYSDRLWTRPTPELSSQLSAARLAHSEAIWLETRTERTASVSFGHSKGDAFFAIRAVSGDFQTPVQLQAAFGLRSFSFRVSSWRRLGSGPTVNAGTLSVVHNLNLLPTGVNTGLGVSMTMYRLGSRFDPVYRRRPVSIQLLFRVRFGAGARNRIGPVGHSTNL
jgi:hypothetical protein